MATKPKPGNPGRGGKRDGAGRPAGTPNVLGYGEVKAIKAAGLRVPKDAPEAHRELADEALERIAAVMREQVHFTAAGPVLKAATQLRAEICGPVANKTEITGANGGALEITVKLEGGE